LAFRVTGHAVRCRAVPCRAVLCRAVLCCAVLCCAVLCCAVLCCAVLCCAWCFEVTYMLHDTILEMFDRDMNLSIYKISEYGGLNRIDSMQFTLRG
jgi:hypothetical protein